MLGSFFLSFFIYLFNFFHFFKEIQGSKTYNFCDGWDSGEEHFDGQLVVFPFFDYYSMKYKDE